MTDEPVRTERGSSEASPHSWARGWMGDSALLLVSQILTVLATSIAAITIARTLDPDDWGIFSAFLGLSLALALVADFGLGTWLLRELVGMLARGETEHRSEQVGRLVSSGVILNAVIALPLVAAAIIWSVARQPGAGVSIALVSLLVYGALTAGANALEADLRARRRIGLVLSASLFEKGVLITLLLAVAVTDAGLAAIGAAYLIAGLSRITFDGTIVFARHGVPFVRPSPRGAAAVARASMPFAVNAASLNLIPRLDILVLITMSTTSAAWFAVGERVLGPALLVPATLGSALYPFMATQAAKHAPPWKLAGLLGILGAALAGIGILLAPILIPLLFGDAYREAVPVTRVMLLIVPLVYATSPLLVIAYSHGRERSLLAPIIVISLAGTVAIVVGQAVGGATMAAAGYVARSALFLVVVGTVALIAWRRHTMTAAASDLSSPPLASVQTP
jgi:O-antigen/teichoic acid export membrane protein